MFFIGIRRNNLYSEKCFLSVFGEIICIQRNVFHRYSEKSIGIQRNMVVVFREIYWYSEKLIDWYLEEKKVFREIKLLVFREIWYTEKLNYLYSEK